MGTVEAAATAVFAALACAGLIVILYPALRRYALAKPNARSSHREPTPQGGGIAVIAATGLALFNLGVSPAAPLVIVLAAAVATACIGAADDVHPLPVAPRLILQALAVAAVIYALPSPLRVLPFLPWGIERLLLFVAGLWFVNLVNFMDGIDWMTAAEVVPITTALAIIGFLGALAPDAVVVALALDGAMIGFAYFNRPTAKLFLGDVGSLPIGLLLGWLLALLAGQAGLAAAVLLPLYYLADATITLVRRLLHGEPIWQAHRSHFYQRAADHGFTVQAIVVRLFTVNVALAALAVVCVLERSHIVNFAAVACGAALVGWLLYTFTRERG